MEEKGTSTFVQLVTGVLSQGPILYILRVYSSQNWCAGVAVYTIPLLPTEKQSSADLPGDL